MDINNLLDKLCEEGEEVHEDVKAIVERKWAVTRVRWGVLGYAAGVATVVLLGWML